MPSSIATNTQAQAPQAPLIPPSQDRHHHQLFKPKVFFFLVPISFSSYVEEEPLMGLRQYQQSGLQYNQYNGQYNVPPGQATGGGEG